ncbi:oxygen-independent coproporphyrinogen III oxidase [Paraburkholderia youngii]
MIDLAPDPLSVFAYSHLPQRFKMQRQIDARTLPDAAERIAILKCVIDRLTEGGYVYIGMDHFSLPSDELALAQRNGTLHRNFQGYSTHADCDLIGLGVSALGCVGNVYAQNEKNIERYEAALARNELPLARGIRLTADDALRREIISRLMCDFRLRFSEINIRYGVDFTRYFARELEGLRALEWDGLLSVDGEGIVVHPPGRLLIRNVCMSFDRYLRSANVASATYSRTV